MSAHRVTRLHRAILAARERRAARQAQLLMTGHSLISLTLNIAGEDKRPPLSGRAMAEAMGCVEACAGPMNLCLLDSWVDEAGHCAIYRVSAEAVSLKRAMVALEDAHPIGRLFDIDVLGGDGDHISRARLGLPGRRCLICGDEAHACARRQAHPLPLIVDRTAAMLKGFFDAQFAERVREAATRALLTELAATPKPGLVDRSNAGAHRDMDFFSFIDSAAALSKHFQAFALHGLEERDERALFARLRVTGLIAERDMMAATGGVNAHKGAIFSLGLISGAAGALFAQGRALTAEALLQKASSLARFTLQDSVPAIRGARAEAIAGFPSVLEAALPTLEGCLARGAHWNDACVAALLSAMARLDDTNLASRSTEESARALRRELRNTLKATCDIPSLLVLAKNLDQAFIDRNLSPGGAADMLAAALMIHFLTIEGEATDVD